MKVLVNSKRIRIAIVIVLIFAAAIAASLVALNAYSSKLQYEINVLNAQIQENSNKLANLEVKIQTATNINNLEDRALTMGLIYPDFASRINIKSSDTVVQDLAAALRDNPNN